MKGMTIIGGDVTLQGCSAPCPDCGKDAAVESIVSSEQRGFDFLREASAAFTSAPMNDLEQFRNVAAAAASGQISAADAANRAKRINSTFAQLIEFAIRWQIPGLLLTIIGLYITIRVAQGDSLDHEELMRELRRQSQQSEQMLENWERYEGIDPQGPPPVQFVPAESRQVRRRAARKASTNPSGRA